MSPLDGIVQFNVNRNLSVFDAKKELNMIELELVEFSEAATLGDEYEQVDALADTIVFAVGAIHKMGYNPTAVLLETLKEINSRIGELDESTGKWEKDKNQDPATLYKAEYSTCKE
jgi:hypothetical protein